MPDFQFPALAFKQSAVVPYRLEKGELEILLITTRKGRWIIPKGIIEPGLAPAASAAKEAEEEAGARGELDHTEIGSFSYEKWGGTCHVRVFALRVTELLETWEEQSFRRRHWFSLKEAIAVVEEDGLKQVLRQVGKYLQKK